VRAIGSLHSQAPVPFTKGICVVLDRYNKLVRVDGSLVTVQAGMRLRTLHRLLAERGLALPVSGTIAEQTVAGAVSTATHGGSLHRGSVSDCVEAVTIVRADGTVVTCGRSEEPFHGLVVSLGLLGMLSTVTLRCVPLFHLRSHVFVRSAPEAFDQFDAIHRDHEFVDMLYYPVTDQVEVLAVDPADESSNPGSISTPMTAPARQSRLAQRLGLAVIRGFGWLMQRSTTLQRVATSRLVGKQYPARTGRSYEVLAFQDREGAARLPGVLRDIELAIPYEHATAALRMLRGHFRSTSRVPLLPLHIRCSAPSESWLSPAYKQPVCWIEFWQYPPSDACLESIQSLLEPFRYRFHWGKASRAAPGYIAAQYDRWDDFVALRRRWDPDGIFGNDYLDFYFGNADTTSEAAKPAARPAPLER
jgi:L-gulonolactone oxidase